jgi:class 3 adenylate cyclase
MSETIQRRLAAIVAADVAEYSRLVREDEEGTLRTLRAHRQDFTDPLIAQFSGRIANTAGDSLLLEFPSAVEAVRCALAQKTCWATACMWQPA